MMQSLIGQIGVADMQRVADLTKLRFKDPDAFTTPEALILHEQRVLSDDKLLDLCMREYGVKLYTPRVTNTPKNVIDDFRDTGFVLLNYNPDTYSVVLGTIPEFFNKRIEVDAYQISKVALPIYFYVDLYQRQYHYPEFLNPIPTRDLLEMIYAEALSLGASDITISSDSKGAQVYYNVRRKKIFSSRYITKENVDEMCTLIPGEAGATMDVTETDAKPRYVAATIDKHTRGRVVINKNYYGRMISMRVLPNKLLTATLEDLNLNPATCEFIRTKMLSKEKGLRLVIGETSSGKNTTILAGINELVNTHLYKIVSVEQPVELLVDGIEQINTETDEEFAQNTDSLLRMNPDYVYLTEITARTSRAIMEQANTAKAVFSTVHANSISDVVFRLSDITSMPLDRLILTLHSCVYQELIRDEERDRIYPYTRCVYFDDDLKAQLYGKSIGEIKSVLKAKELEWDKAHNSVNGGLVKDNDYI